MPIYEYACAGCGAQFEHLTLARQETPPPCPSCGGQKTEKLVSAPTAVMSSNATGCGERADACPSAPSCAGGGGFS